MTSPTTASGVGTTPQKVSEAQLSLSIRQDKGGPETKRVPIPSSYLRDFRQELLLKYALRHGMPDATLDDMSIEMMPIYHDDDQSRCRGLRVDVTNPRGESFQHDYNAYLFSDVVSRVVGDLSTQGMLTLEDNYYYEIVVEPDKRVEVGPALGNMSFGTGPKQQPLGYLTRPLKPFMAQAQPVGEPTSEHFPAFYTAEAYTRAERFARLGAESQPPRETGAALIGSACSCPESGEFYVVVTHALEAIDAEEGKVSLSYTGKTWSGLQTILKSIQSQPATKTYRFLGQAHGHNFVPLDGAPPCELCATAKVCSRTSVFVSIDDRTWTQAVFAGAPYALCHIFGLNARLEHVHGLYSLSENHLTQRGFYIIPDFDPTST